MISDEELEYKQLQDKIREFRYIEQAIWRYIIEDTDKYIQLLRQHEKLERCILDLYKEITLMNDEHRLYTQIHTEKGKKITELLHALKLRLTQQYADLIEINEVYKKSNKMTFSEEELANIRAILNGNKNGLDESENSQKIKAIEIEIAQIIEEKRADDMRILAQRSK